MAFALLFGLPFASLAKKAGSKPLAQDATNLILSDQGYGVVKFGLKLKAIEKSLKEKAEIVDAEESCLMAHFKSYPDISFMVESGVITRAESASGKMVKNSYGINSGDLLKDVKAKHPKVRIEAHEYDEKGHYVIFDSKDSKRAVLFEESEGKLTNVRAGLKPSVEYVEGCL